MKKFTLLFITILAVGLLGSTQAGSQKNGKYMLDNNGYQLIELDEKGQVTTRIVENKDVPWYIRFNPSSNLAGIWDNRTSLLRRLKKAAVAASIAAPVILYCNAMRKKIALDNEELKKRNEELKKRLEKSEKIKHFIEAGLFFFALIILF